MSLLRPKVSALLHFSITLPLKCICLYSLVYLDGGVRRGTDVIKSLCLGATAVSLGRPFLYAQSVSTTPTPPVEPHTELTFVPGFSIHRPTERLV